MGLNADVKLEQATQPGSQRDRGVQIVGLDVDLFDLDLRTPPDNARGAVPELVRSGVTGLVCERSEELPDEEVYRRFLASAGPGQK